MTVVYPRFEGEPLRSDAQVQYLDALRAILHGNEQTTGRYLNAAKAAVLRENLPTHHNARTDETFAHSSQLTNAFIAVSLPVSSVEELESLYGDYGCNGSTPWLRSNFSMEAEHKRRGDTKPFYRAHDPLETVRRGIVALGDDRDFQDYQAWRSKVDTFWQKHDQVHSAPAARIA